MRRTPLDCFLSSSSLLLPPLISQTPSYSLNSLLKINYQVRSSEHSSQESHYFKVGVTISGGGGGDVPSLWTWRWNQNVGAPAVREAVDFPPCPGGCCWWRSVTPCRRSVNLWPPGLPRVRATRHSPSCHKQKNLKDRKRIFLYAYLYCWSVLRIRDIFCTDSDPRIRTPDNGSWSWYFRLWPSRWQQKIIFFSVFLLISLWNYIYIVFQR